VACVYLRAPVFIYVSVCLCGIGAVCASCRVVQVYIRCHELTSSCMIGQGVVVCAWRRVAFVGVCVWECVCVLARLSFLVFVCVIVRVSHRACVQRITAPLDDAEEARRACCVASLGVASRVRACALLVAVKSVGHEAAQNIY
jgi:hypothetical protein